MVFFLFSLMTFSSWFDDLENSIDGLEHKLWNSLSCFYPRINLNGTNTHAHNIHDRFSQRIVFFSFNSSCNKITNRFTVNDCDAMRIVGAFILYIKYRYSFDLKIPNDELRMI